MDRMRFASIPKVGMNTDRRRLSLAFLVSLLFHGALLSLTFGGEGLGMPGFGLPWKERRIEAPDLRVMLAPLPATATEATGTTDRAAEAPRRQSSTEQIIDGGPTRTPTVSFAPKPEPATVASEPKAAPTPRTEPVPDGTPPPLPPTSVAPVAPAAPAKPPSLVEDSSDALNAPPIPRPPVIAMERSDEETWVVPAPPAPPSVVAVAPAVPNPEVAMSGFRDTGEPERKPAEPEMRERAVEAAAHELAEREAQRRADRLEAARVEAARLEAERREAARLEAQRQEMARLEAERREAERMEAQRREAARLEAERQEAARIEAQRQEAVRQAGAKAEAERQAAERAEAERMQAMRQEAARQAAAMAEAQRQEMARAETARAEAARAEAARVQAEQEEDARREARRRAMGRQLEEAAARRQAEAAARSTKTLPLSLSTARRVRLWGRSDPNAHLVDYAEAWARRIQFNTPVETVREVAQRPHTQPMVTVAIRSDGSIEAVKFEISSGVAEVDEAIRRIVESHAPFPAFPPGLVRDYDVIEVRRTWHFDTAIRLY